MRMDLSSFEDSFGVEKKSSFPFYPPPPVLKELTRETFCRQELCTLLFWESLRGTGHAVLGLAVNWNSLWWEGRGEQLARLVWIVSLQAL